MTSSKKARGRARRDERALDRERRAHAAHNQALGRTAPVALDDDGPRFFDSEFVPMSLTSELAEVDGVRFMQNAVKEGLLVYWELGRKGTHISSHFLTNGGTEDYLTSPNPRDEDYGSLVLAHMNRLAQIFGLEPDPITGQHRLVEGD